jgi:cell division protein FtsQ
VNTKRIIQKIVFITLTLVACSGLVVLLVAAIGKKNHERCRDYVINIKGAQHNLFIDESDIKKLLAQTVTGKIAGERMSDFNLRRVEQVIRTNPWVNRANLYFDNRDVLHINVVENEPIARIFTTNGKSFYIDSTTRQMPLSDKMSARVPVFTNFPQKKFLSKKDSALLDDMKRIALFILNDSFWMAQTEQIDIMKDRGFEMIPTIGNHIVRLGNGSDIDKKFHRLFVFYQQVMSKTGFNKYNLVDVQFDGQVIGATEKISKIDSVQLKKNIEKLLQEAKDAQHDTATVKPSKEMINPRQQASTGSSAADMKINPHPVPTSSSLGNAKTTSNAKPKLIDKKPKAVMPDKN